uniref:Uncharacterized protein n=1 Tax=Arundo donax TaxID=35708 RepID=A0A0A9DF79_ARUDO
MFKDFSYLSWIADAHKSKSMFFFALFTDRCGSVSKLGIYVRCETVALYLRDNLLN